MAPKMFYATTCWTKTSPSRWNSEMIERCQQLVRWAVHGADSCLSLLLVVMVTPVIFLEAYCPAGWLLGESIADWRLCCRSLLCWCLWYNITSFSDISVSLIECKFNVIDQIWGALHKVPSALFLIHLLLIATKYGIDTISSIWVNIWTLLVE